MCDVVRAHCLCIVAGVEAAHIKGHTLCAPQTELGNTLAVIARNIHIIRNSVNCGVINVLKVVVVVVPVLVYLTIEMYLDSLVGNRNQPRAAAGQPVIRKLGLPAVNDLLLEDTVFITDRIARCRIFAGSKTVHVAGSKSAQTAVAQTSVRLFVIYAVYLDAHVLERFLGNVLHTEVVQAGLEGTSHKKFHREVINLLPALGIALAHKVMALFLQVVHHDRRKRTIYLRDSGILSVCSEIKFQNTIELSSQLLLCKRRIHSFLTPF